MPLKRNTYFDYRIHEFYLENPTLQKRHQNDSSVMTFYG